MRLNHSMPLAAYAGEVVGYHDPVYTEDDTAPGTAVVTVEPTDNTNTLVLLAVAAFVFFLWMDDEF